MNHVEITKENIEKKFTNAVDYFGLYIPNLLSFYALFTKRVNNNIQSMRICVKTDVTPYLEYNEEWVCSIDKSVFVFIMAIELYRFILHHCTHRELQGPNAYKASTAVCNSKELQFFLSSAPSDVAEYVRKAVWSKITIEDEIGKKIDKDDFYYEAVYDMLNQNQEQQQQSQQNGQSQDGEGQQSQQTKSKKDKGADNGKDENDNRESGDSSEGDEDQEDQGQGEGESQEDQDQDGSGDDADSEGSSEGLRGDQQSDSEGEGSGDGDAQHQPGTGSGESDSEDSNSGSGKEKFDDWNQSGEENTEEWGQNNIVDEMIRDVIENKCKLSGWGKLSGEQVEEIMLKNKRKVNIVPIIAGFGRTVRCRKRISTRLRVNKRYEYLPGYRTDRKSRMLFAIDSSGSMSQSDIEKGCAILHNFYKKTEIDLAFWDAQMVEPKKLTKNIQKIEAPGRGGTDPVCIGEWLKQHNKHYDGVVIFTDCYWEWKENNLAPTPIFVISSEEKYSLPNFIKHHASIQELTKVFDD
jgi:predicted metal-dependent peptidase